MAKATSSWTNWEVILLRMYEKRIRIFETTSLHPPCSTRYTCDGSSIHSSSIRALESRGYIIRKRNKQFKIVWHLTNMGRAAAKRLQL